MTWKQALYMGLLVILALSVSGCVLEGGYKYTGTQTTTEVVDLAGVDTVVMRLGSTDVEIVSKDVAEATFVIKKRYRSNKEDYGPELLEEAQVTFEKEGSRLIIERKKTEAKGLEMITKGYVSIDIEATLPAGLTLDIITGSGDLDIDDRTAPIRITSGSGDVTAGNAAAGFDAKSGSGDMHLRSGKGMVSFKAGSGDFYAGNIEGDVEIGVGSGDVELGKVIGDISVTSGSGDIEVDGCVGDLVAKSGSGDMEFGRHQGNVDIVTSSGDVELEAAAGQGEISIRTSSGDVDVVIYEPGSVDLDLRTSTGVMNSKIPLVVREVSRKRLHGLAGEGALKVDISTASGDIYVRQGSI